MDYEYICPECSAILTAKDGGLWVCTAGTLTKFNEPVRKCSYKGLWPERREKLTLTAEKNK